MREELLNETTAAEYLVARGLIELPAECEILTGGVSNVVIAVKAQGKNLVLKQALAELKVATKWEADQRRAIVEAHALRWFNSVSPQSVPELVDFDSSNFSLVLTRVALGGTQWKEDLLDGQINPQVTINLGKILAQWHNAGRGDKKLEVEFPLDNLFEQLRVDPFYRYVSIRNPRLSSVITNLIDEITLESSTMVHGDFSPKNIMLKGNQPFILDFEVAHFGNPVFDLAFLLAHLCCKTMRTDSPNQKRALIESAENFLDAYEKVSDLAPSKSLGMHTALIALARVEGKSTVNYLSPDKVDRLALITKEFLLSTGSIQELLELLNEN